MVYDPPEAQRYRKALIDRIHQHSGVRNIRVLRALYCVPRHLFIPHCSLAEAYVDHALPIGHGQTISQPTIVAIMTDALDLHGTERVLEIGTGSGYQTAVLSQLASHVYSIEVVPHLIASTAHLLEELGCQNVHIRYADGYLGWPEDAPFDRIIITAAPPEIPSVLETQLKEGGIMVLPVGQALGQQLLCCKKINGQLQPYHLGAVAFVPMVPQKESS